MLKKSAIILSIAAATSFAEWDYYGVPEVGHGTVSLAGHYWYNGDYHSTDLDVNAFVGVFKNLGLSVQGLGYQFFGDPNDETEEGKGFKDLTVGLKYALGSNAGVFIDVGIPSGADEVTNDTWSVKGGFSWVIPVTEKLGIGNEFGLTIPFEHDGVNPGISANYGFEIYYNYESGFTPFFGFVFASQLTDTVVKTKEEPHPGHVIEKREEFGAGTSNISFWFGTTYQVNSHLSFSLYTDIEYAPAAYYSGYILKANYNF